MWLNRHFRGYFLATRPAFLSISIMACFIGFAIAAKISQINWGINIVCFLLVLLVHAAANLSNDYFDSLNGSDAQNTQCVSPFTGGSRFIQNNFFTEIQIKQLSLSIYLTTIFGGIMLSWMTSWHLIWVGLGGLILGWFYSAPPLKLMCRGLWGEIAIVCAWTLVVIGSTMISTKELNATSLILGLAYGLMVANILFVNQIPDIEADQRAGKLTLAVKTPKQYLWLWTLILSGVAYGLLLAFVGLGSLPKVYLLPLLCWPLNIVTAYEITVDNHQSKVASIKQTILASHLFGLLLLVSTVIA